MPASPRDEALLRLLNAPDPAWVATVTQRLAFTLRSRIAELRAAAGVTVAETPPLRVLEEWLVVLGRETLAREAAAGAPGRVLLPPAAEQLLWERVIASSPGDLPAELLDTAALAVTAADAWKRVCLWGEPSWSGPLVEDAERFREWLPRFRARLDAEGFVTRAELAGLLAAAISRGELDGRLPKLLVLLGFEKEDPAARLFADALASRGVAIAHELDLPAVRETEVRAWSAAKPSAELRSVAATIRERLLDDPSLRVGVVAPDTAAFGARLERVFEEELDPAGVLDVSGTPVRRFDFAEAPALADYPLVASALDLLSVVERRVPFETVSRILLSDHPRSGDDADAVRIRRGEVDAKLRRERSAVLHLAGRESSVAAVLRRSGLVPLAERLERLGKRLEAGSGARRAPSAWRSEWIERLALCGWPGAIAGDTEGLVYRRWRDALDEFAMLEIVERSLGEAEALERLRGICAATRVQPPASSRSVQVMNLLDASGLEFDVVFAIGLTATAFPAPPSPNPLLPVRWQREQVGMPRVSVEAERELADRIWSRLRRSTRELYASWPIAGDDDDDQSPSGIFAALELGPGTPAPAEPWWLAAAKEAPLREERPIDIAGPALVRRGGSGLLQHQSDCAFRAFASQRLGAERLDAIRPQPDAARRGMLVHAALQAAYGAIRSRGELLGLSADNIADVALDSAKAAIQKNASFFADAADLEDAARLWLKDLVSAWMLYERDARFDDWEIDQVETQMQVEFPPSVLDPLRLDLRPDRIDRLRRADGGDALLVLDFKTASTPRTTSKWSGDRPEDIQLPLYLALLAQQGRMVSGIAFANLSARDSCELQGLAADELAPTVKPPRKIRWEDAAAGWTVMLEQLALDYLGGRVRTDPRGAKVCGQCGSQPLCRIRETGVLADEDDEDGVAE